MLLLVLQVHGGDEFVAPQWARRLYGSFTAHEKYPIKNVSNSIYTFAHSHSRLLTIASIHGLYFLLVMQRYGEDEEVVTPQPHHLYGNFTTDEKIPIKNVIVYTLLLIPT